MLFLYRPRQTWMPFALPRSSMQQAAYNRQLQQRFASTQRVAPATPAPLPPPAPATGPVPRRRDPLDDLQRLGELRREGLLTDAEFDAVKARLLAS
jgi:hypothetical protein